MPIPSHNKVYGNGASFRPTAFAVDRELGLLVHGTLPALVNIYEAVKEGTTAWLQFNEWCELNLQGEAGILKGL